MCVHKCVCIIQNWKRYTHDHYVYVSIIVTCVCVPSWYPLGQSFESVNVYKTDMYMHLGLLMFTVYFILWYRVIICYLSDLRRSQTPRFNTCVAIFSSVSLPEDNVYFTSRERVYLLLAVYILRSSVPFQLSVLWWLKLIQYFQQKVISHKMETDFVI